MGNGANTDRLEQVCFEPYDAIETDRLFIVIILFSGCWGLDVYSF